MNEDIQLFFHAPCFDGAVSAALASDYFERKLGRVPSTLVGVNYHLKDTWLLNSPSTPFAVVDFLYHPAAEFWADHHPTAFLTESVKKDFETRRGNNLLYDGSASSCAILIWQHWGDVLRDRKEHYRETVRWADLIDSARYSSVQEAVNPSSAAMQINVALAMSQDKSFPQKLVTWIRLYELSEVAAMPEIQMPFQAGRSLQEEGLQRLKKSIQLAKNGIAVFDVDSTGVLVNRYAPFYFYPHARYSAGILRDLEKARLTIMRNPWIDFPSAPLGEFCAPFGGGGHRRVGSIVLRGGKRSDASLVLNKLLDQIETWEKEKMPVEGS